MGGSGLCPVPGICPHGVWVTVLRGRACCPSGASVGSEGGQRGHRVGEAGAGCPGSAGPERSAGCCVLEGVCSHPALRGLPGGGGGQGAQRQEAGPQLQSWSERIS